MRMPGVFSVPEVGQLGKALIGFGIAIAIAGGALMLADKLGVSRLPGDIFFKRGNVRIYAPVVSMIVVSVILTVVLNLIFWLFRR